jgi:hypothetical protein
VNHANNLLVVLVPEGLPRIAQRFNAGCALPNVLLVPEGTVEPTCVLPANLGIVRPFGTGCNCTATPTVETVGYSRPSLRDGLQNSRPQILVASPEDGRTYSPISKDICHHAHTDFRKVSASIRFVSYHEF